MSSHDQPEADNRGQVPQAPTDPSQRAAHDDILHVLDEFSTGLQSLQHLYAQRQVLQDKLRATEAALAAREEAVRTREESLDAERARLAEELASLSSARAELDRARADCETKSAEVEHERAALAARREQSDADTRSRDQALATREQELAARENDSRESLRVIEAARAELDAEKAALDLARTSLETQLAEVAGLREELSHERERLSKEADSLRELSEKNGHEAASFASLEGEAARLRDALAAGADLASDYASLWLVELARAESLRAQGEESVASLGELEGVLEQLKHRLREEHEAAEEARLAESEAREAERRACEALAHAQRAHPVGNEGLEHLRRRLDLRQRRLSQGRVVLRAQADKIRRGGEALRKRFEQAEQVLAQRAELAGIRQRLIAENARIQRHKAGSRAGVITLCAVGVLGLLGALSWALARQIAPATFRVESEIRADGRGRELSSAELEEWQRFHQELVSDPRFHEAAAEKFKRQGLLALASPAAVGSMVSDSLAVDSDANGEMKLILRGQGSDATRRELETLTAALVAYANTAQQQRIDGGLTAVSKPATPDASPIDRTREFYALGILGGSTLLSLILAVTIWKRLSGAKSAFEQDSMLQAALAETTTWDVSERG